MVVQGSLPPGKISTQDFLATSSAFPLAQSSGCSQPECFYSSLEASLTAIRTTQQKQSSFSFSRRNFYKTQLNNIFPSSSLRSWLSSGLCRNFFKCPGSNISDPKCSTRVKTQTDKIQEMNICCSNQNKLTVSVKH